MDIKTSKIELVKLILNIESSDFIKKLTNYIKDEKADFWNELSASEKKEIKKGIKQLENGKRSSWDDTLKKIS